MLGGSIQDQMLKTYIDNVFMKYDTDNNGSLDVNEITVFFNDLFRSLNMNVQINQYQAIEAVREIYKDFDG